MNQDDINKIETLAGYLWAFWIKEVNVWNGVDRQKLKQEVDDWIEEIKER